MSAFIHHTSDLLGAFGICKSPDCVCNGNACVWRHWACKFEPQAMELMSFVVIIKNSYTLLK